MSLEDQLMAELLASYEETKSKLWNPTGFRQMLEDRGALGTATYLAGKPQPSDGFTKLFEKKRLDLSVEAVILRGPWIELFDEETLSQARRKLRGVGYAIAEFDATSEQGRAKESKSSGRRNGVAGELQRRLHTWRTLVESGEAEKTNAATIREHRIYSGARGMYADKNRTKEICADQYGITVGVLHTGRHYEDDLSENDLIYHYPFTNKPGHDFSDIEATKNAGRFSLPIFVITHPTPNSKDRQVRLGWVEDWDDEQKVFLVNLAEQPAGLPKPDEAETEFALTKKSKKKTTTTTTRPNQQRFGFEVFKRYGFRCAVCGITGDGLLDAAHICGKASNGSDDPRNGLPLCALHHRAFDRFYFGIEPNSLKVVPGKSLKNLESIYISKSDIGHLDHKPHIDALRWLWDKFEKSRN